MRIAMIDPADFSPPYDEALVGGLRGLGHDAVLFGAVGGPMSGSEFRRPTFYRLLANRPAIPPKLAQIAKGLHHGVDLVRLVADLQRFRPDIVHFQWAPLPLVDGWVLKALHRIAPTVLTMHDTVPYHGATSALMRLGVNRLARRVDAVVVHTEGAREHLARTGVAPERLFRIPHGLLHAASIPGRPACRSEDGPVTLLQFGKIKPYKGVDVLLAALTQVEPEVRQGLRVRIVGRPYLDPAPLTQAIEAHGLGETVQLHLDFVPEPELVRLFEAADAAVFPYRRIDASGVLMTAVACGLPVIASRLGGFAELLEDGREALLVEPGDSRALARAITTFVRSPKRRMAMRQAMQQVRDDIPSWDAIAAQTVGVYHGLRQRRAPLTRPGFVAGRRFESAD